MEPEGSLPHSQEPATCPYPERYFTCTVKISVDTENCVRYDGYRKEDFSKEIVKDDIPEPNVSTLKRAPALNPTVRKRL
jgi:hypothetical protein